MRKQNTTAKKKYPLSDAYTFSVLIFFSVTDTRRWLFKACIDNVCQRDTIQANYFLCDIVSVFVSSVSGTCATASGLFQALVFSLASSASLTFSLPSSPPLTFFFFLFFSHSFSVFFFSFDFFYAPNFTSFELHAIKFTLVSNSKFFE